MAAIDYIKAMDEYQKAKDYELQQQAVALQQQIDQYSGQRDKINKNYAEAADTAYNNAQLTSRGRAENLAAMGLGRGYYDAPSSGYGQQLISRADTELRDALNKIGLEKADKLTDVDNYISQAQAAAKANSYTVESTYAQKLAELLKEQADAKAQYDLQMRQLAGETAPPPTPPPTPPSYPEPTPYDLAKAKYLVGNHKDAYEIIFNAIPENDRSLEMMAAIMSGFDKFDDNVYEFKNWWYSKNSSKYNGWGMNW